MMKLHNIKSEDVKRLRDEKQISLHEAYRELLKNEIYDEINQAQTLEDLKSVLCIIVNQVM